jgi:hypothetical protein
VLLVVSCSAGGLAWRFIPNATQPLLTFQISPVASVARCSMSERVDCPGVISEPSSQFLVNRSCSAVPTCSGDWPNCHGELEHRADVDGERRRPLG